MAKIAEIVIRWGFYLLFFLVPLVFFSGSFELFEYNKMMLAYALTLIIGSAWATKMIINRKFNFRRTPLDIPIALYLGAHVLSTIFSIDVHTSVWGYYSRFHEGLLATISYIILYYAAVTNLNKQDLIKIFYFSFAAGTIVSLWGTLEHFGHSPSCAFITGKFDNDCWIQDVKNRVFATLGQPNWMAAYLDILILIFLGFVFTFNKIKPYILVLSPLLFMALLFTKSRSGFLGLIAGLGVFVILSSLRHLRNLGPILVSFVFIALLFGLPFSQIDKFNLESFLNKPAPSIQQLAPKPDPGYIDIGVSESGDIRKIVWDGALKIWQRYPIFGSGVETFAYSYYKDRPIAHNMVSEWDFLYNKAHNEFLNILATTGLVGMFAYLSILGAFSWWSFKNKKDPLLTALYAAWISILVTNFFGFSVVIIGLFFFLIPAFSFILKNPEQATTKQSTNLSVWQWAFIVLINLIALFLLINLVTMWQADKSFAYGKNLDGIQQYQSAYPYLIDAIKKSPNEPTFRDELAYNQSVLALAFFQQSSSSAEAKQLANDSITNSNLVLETSPNILSFWKTRTRLFYNLTTIDRRYLFEALNSIRKASELAPSDAKVNYNLGLLLGQTGDIKGGIQILKKTVEMKPDYADAHYALGIYYAEIGQKQKAKEQMEYMLKKIGNDERAKKWLEENK